MAAVAYPEYGICAVRLTLASCATADAITGAKNAYVTDALESGKFTREVIQGGTLQAEKACISGEQAYRIVRPDRVVGGKFEFTALTGDPYLDALFAQGTWLTSGGNDIGFIEETGVVSSFLFCEVWTENVQKDCAADANWLPYRRSCYGIGRPQVTDTSMGKEIRKFNGAIELQPFMPPTVATVGWKGPHDDFPASVGTQILAWQASNKKTMRITFNEATIPVAAVGYIPVP